MSALQQALISTTPVVLHVTFVAGSSSSSSTVNKPTGTAQNDIMVMVGSGSSAAGVWTPPSGWTDIFAGGTAFAGAAYKVAGASEPSSYSYTNGAAFLSAGIMTFRGCTIGVIGTANGNAGGSSITTNSVTATVVNSMLIAMAANSSQLVPSTPAGMTSGASNSTNTGYNMCYQEVPAGATGGKTFSGSGGQYTAGMITLNPA